MPDDFFPEADCGRWRLFDGLSRKNLRLLAARSLMQTVEERCMLVQQGEVPAWIYLIIEGQVKTSRYGKDGRESTIRMLQKGDVCMEAVLFMGGPSPVSAQTLAPCRLLAIPASIVKAQVLADPRFAQNLLRILSTHYRNAIYQVESLSGQSPVQRVGYYFLRRLMQEGQDGLAVSLPFRKQTIANHLGMTPETFSRTLKHMRRMGIDVKQGAIHIRDVYSLCSFCDTDTAAVCKRRGKNSCCRCPAI